MIDWHKKAHALRAQGMSNSDIAGAMGKSYHTVRDIFRGSKPDIKSTIDKTEQKKIKTLLASLERARAPRVKIKTVTTKSANGDFSRVVVPDTHGVKADPIAIAAFLSDLKSIAPREIVLLGDHLDCGGFLAQHHTMGYVAETEYTFEDDVRACNQFLDEVQSRAPGARIYYLEGNHERRMERWCVTQALANKKDSDYLRRMFSAESVLSLKARGIEFFKQGVFYHDLRIPATIKLGKCYFTHGTRAGKNAAADILSDFAGNIVFAHTHRADAATKRTVADGVIGAWNPGCLCLLQPLWQHTQITGWSHGYGLQLVRLGGEFLHINVPIIEGKSLMLPLTKKLA